MTTTLFSCSVGAATLTVTTTNDSGPGSLRQAIQDAVPDTIINFSVRGTITLTNGELVVSTNLNIIGPGAEGLTVSGGWTSRVFNVRGGTVLLSGLTITDGRLISGDGAGISNAGALGIEQCALLNNRTLNGSGGGIYNSGGLSVRDSIFLQNQVGGTAAFGGAIFSTRGRVTLTNSFLVRNSAAGVDGGFAVWPQGAPGGGAARGGGLYLDSGQVTLANCAVTGNSVSGGRGGSVLFPNLLVQGGPGGSASGGGIFQRTGSVTIVATSLSSNWASGGLGGGSQGYPGGSGGTASGGGISLESGTLSVMSTTLSGNTSSGGGGGYSPAFLGGTGGDASGGGTFQENGYLTVINSTLAGNFSVGGGGGGSGDIMFQGRGGSGGSARGAGIFVNSGSLTNLGCTMAGNQGVGGPGGAGGTSSGTAGSGMGGGIFNGSLGAVSLLNTLLAANRATSTHPDASGIFTSQGFNLVGVTNGSSGWLASDLNGSAATPLNPQLGPLQDNGGPTYTMALQPGSPAIDRGAGAGLTVDQRGRLRPIDNLGITNAPGGDGGDIGAYEVEPPPTLSIRLAVPADGFNTVILSWPNPSTGYLLQRTANMSGSGGGWMAFTQMPVINGSNKEVTLSATGISHVFRLRQP